MRDTSACVAGLLLLGCGSPTPPPTESPEPTDPCETDPGSDDCCALNTGSNPAHSSCDECDCHSDSCFVGSVRVDTPSGPRRIADIAVGDEVLAFDVDTREVVVQRVTHVLRNTATRIGRLEAGDITIEGVTGEHPFFDPEQLEWVRAAELEVGSPVVQLMEHGETVPTAISSAAWHDELEPVDVYNLTIDGPHTYFVERVLVHNKSPAPQFVWIGYAGGGNYDIPTDTYGGAETFGVYEFDDYADPQLGDVTVLCEFTWQASNPTPAPAGCDACTWTANVTMGTGVESGPADGCAVFEVDATINEGLTFGYGYNPAYDYQGSVLPVLMYYSQSNMAWGLGTNLGVSYDRASGDLTYIFLTDYGYL